MKIRGRAAAVAAALMVMLCVSSSQAIEWATKAPMPTARYGAACGQVNGKLYVCGGYNTPSQFDLTLSVVESYDPQSDMWATRTPMPYGLGLSGAAVVNDRVYVAGGVQSWGGYWQSTLFEYNPATDQWTERSPMPTPRYGVACAAVGGKLFAIGGYSNYQFVNTCEMYDPATNSWTTKAPMPTERFFLGCAVVNGLVYAIGGGNGSGLLEVTEVYDPVANTWETKAPMPTARYGLGCCACNDRIIAAGGYNGVELATVEVYDPANNTWTSDNNMPTARFGLVASAVNGVAYAIGGLRGDYDYLATNEAGAVRLPATVHFDPRELNLKSKGRWVTCYIELPNGFPVSDIDIASVAIGKINGQPLVPSLCREGQTEIGDFDQDGTPDLMVKFNRQELIDVLVDMGIEGGDQVELTVTGNLVCGRFFEGSDVIGIVENGDDGHGEEMVELLNGDLQTSLGVVPLGNAFQMNYSLATGGNARLDICDVTGRLIRTLVNARQPSGRHEATWDGTDNSGRGLPKGTYFIAMRAGEFRTTRKIVKTN